MATLHIIWDPMEPAMSFPVPPSARHAEMHVRGDLEGQDLYDVAKKLAALLVEQIITPETHAALTAARSAREADRRYMAILADIKREPSGARGAPADLMTIDELREEVPRLRAMLDAECRVTLELRRRLTATKAST